MRAGRVPLHVKSRLGPGDGRLMDTIDHELARSEACCGVCACSVILSGDARAGFRAMVALELDSGEYVSHSAKARQLELAIANAFTSCREDSAASAEQ